MATDEQRREVENLHAMTVDVARRLTNTVATAERDLSHAPSVPGFLREALDRVDAALGILSEMTQKMESDGD